MRPKIISRIIIALFCTLTVFNFGMVTISANSAQSWFEGIDSTGAMMADEESPIIVERELLTFDISGFPDSYYDEKDEFDSYASKVSAEYTFYNPSEFTVTAKLMFPFGNMPSYIHKYYDDDGEYKSFDDTDKYDITVNGEIVEKKIRHSLKYSYQQFVLEKDLAMLEDGFAEDEFYKSDLTVTKYVFQVSELNSEQNKDSYHNAAAVAFDVKKGIGDHRIWLPEHNGCHMQKDGDMRLHISVRQNMSEFELYVFGAPLSELPEWKVYADGWTEDGEEIYGKVELINSETMIFEDFALSYRPEGSAASDIDWYNAVVAELKGNKGNSDEYPVALGTSFEYDFDSSLMRWYEYEITLAPGERIVNKVTAPMYPAIDLGYEPDIYEYTYLLSPAKTWKSFGELEIVINTPYYITESGLGSFEKTDKGYSMLLSRLPDGELTFTLSTSQAPQREYSPYYIAAVVIVSGFILLVALVVGTIVMAIVLIKRKRKKRGGNK